MRDIRGDLQERVRLIEEQINLAYAHFEKVIGQLQKERDERITELKAELQAIGKLIQAEHRRMLDVDHKRAAEVEQLRAAEIEQRRAAEIEQRRAAENEQRRTAELVHVRNDNVLTLTAPVASQSSQLSATDFVLRKLNEFGPLSQEDLINFALQENIYPEIESAEQGIHATLTRAVRNDQVRKLHDGSYVTSAPPQALRPRRVK
jgi:hypothetical protein